jgi:hypothetical protein
MAIRKVVECRSEEVVSRGIVTGVRLLSKKPIDMLYQLNRAIYSNRNSNSEYSYDKYVPKQP